MKKILGIIVVAIIVILVLALVFGKGLGLGKGNGSSDGNSIATSQTTVEESVDADETDETIQVDASSKELPNTITITIKEDKVYVEDKQIADAEELKSYIEEINTDNKEYILKDENSILDTYEWVTNAFDELKIKLGTE